MLAYFAGVSENIVDLVVVGAVYVGSQEVFFAFVVCRYLIGVSEAFVKAYSIVEAVCTSECEVWQRGDFGEYIAYPALGAVVRMVVFKHAERVGHIGEVRAGRNSAAEVFTVAVDASGGIVCRIPGSHGECCRKHVRHRTRCVVAAFVCVFRHSGHKRYVLAYLEPVGGLVAGVESCGEAAVVRTYEGTFLFEPASAHRVSEFVAATVNRHVVVLNPCVAEYFVLPVGIL